MTTKNIIRTQWDGVYEVYSDSWGTRLRKTYDDEGTYFDAKEFKELLNTLELNPNFARIPNKLFNQIVSFFSEFQIESQVTLVRKEDDLSVWDALVPRQQNTSGSCDSDKTDLISLTTGVVSKNLPIGWVESGSAHSHPYMSPHPSPTDDLSEKHNTGLHFIIGGDWTTKTFSICASICIGGNRYVFAPQHLIAGNFAQKTKDDSEHLIIKPQLYATLPSVKAYVTQKVLAPKKAKNTFVGWSKQQYYDEFFSDPFHVSDTYNNLKLRKFDEGKKCDKVKSAIEDYIFDGGNAQLLRDFITELENELFTLYNF